MAINDQNGQTVEGQGNPPETTVATGKQQATNNPNGDATPRNEHSQTNPPPHQSPARALHEPQGTTTTSEGHNHPPTDPTDQPTHANQPSAHISVTQQNSTPPADDSELQPSATSTQSATASSKRKRGGNDMNNTNEQRDDERSAAPNTPNLNRDNEPNASKRNVFIGWLRQLRINNNAINNLVHTHNIFDYDSLYNNVQVWTQTPLHGVDDDTLQLIGFAREYLVNAGKLHSQELIATFPFRKFKKAYPEATRIMKRATLTELIHKADALSARPEKEDTPFLEHFIVLASATLTYGREYATKSTTQLTLQQCDEVADHIATTNAITFPYQTFKHTYETARCLAISNRNIGRWLHQIFIAFDNHSTWWCDDNQDTIGNTDGLWQPYHRLLNQLLPGEFIETNKTALAELIHKARAFNRPPAEHNVFLDHFIVLAATVLLYGVPSATRTNTSLTTYQCNTIARYIDATKTITFPHQSGDLTYASAKHLAFGNRNLREWLDRIVLALASHGTWSYDNHNNVIGDRRGLWNPYQNLLEQLIPGKFQNKYHAMKPADRITPMPIANACGSTSE